MAKIVGHRVLSGSGLRVHDGHLRVGDYRTGLIDDVAAELAWQQRLRLQVAGRSSYHSPSQGETSNVARSRGAADAHAGLEVIHLLCCTHTFDEGG